MEMDVTIEPKEAFYDTYINWCGMRSFPPRGINEIDTVFVCWKDNKAIYSCFFWNTNSTFCVIGFPFGNPHIPYAEREGGMQFLFEEIARIAKESGYEIIWTTSDTERVVESLTGSGFKVADTKVDQYYRVLF